MLKINFNKGWEIGENITALTSAVTGKKKSAEIINLPHDAMITTKRNAGGPTGPGGGYFQGGNYEYVKRFTVSEDDKGKVIFLEFEGVYMHAFVFVNGDLVGNNQYGYSNFYVQINDYLHYGQENEVKVVSMNNAQPNTRWYSGSGIYRNVSIMKADPVHIIPDGIRITTIHSEPELAIIQMDTILKNENIGLQTGFIMTEIKDASGDIVTTETTKFSIASNSQSSLRQRLTIMNPKLWNLDIPYLYISEIRIQIENHVVDLESIPFGIRKLQLDSVNGLRINGETVKLKGGCIHHDNGVLGAATFEDAEFRRIYKLKEAGYNAIRMSHHPISRAMLHACDRIGMLVLEELADTWTVQKVEFDYAINFNESWEIVVERMVGKSYNHPSVVMYSIGNELIEIGSAYGNIMGRKIIEKIRSLDDTRYITNGINLMMTAKNLIDELIESLGITDVSKMTSGEINETMQTLGPLVRKIMEDGQAYANVQEAFDSLDISGYNYSPERYLIDRKQSKHKVFLGTETNPASLDKNWRLVKEHGFVLGDFSWTAWDYLGEVGIGAVRYGDEQEKGFYGPYPWLTALTGDFDITGYRLPISYWREIIWGGRNHTPYISVQNPERYGQEAKLSNWGWTNSISSWTWPNYEGQGIVVEVYSDAEEVELFINGKSKGKQTVGNEFKEYYCTWDTIFEPGVVEAIAYREGKEAGCYQLKTAGVPKLTVTKEREQITAGTNDLCYVNIELADDKGILNTAVNKKVSFTLEGPASVQGSGTGRGKTEANYNDKEHETFNGRMLIVVRAGEDKGLARLTVETEGLQPVTIEIPVV